MFTGIVRERGRVVGFTDGRLEIEAPATASDAAIGDSVSVSGACLTVVSVDEARLGFDVVPETVGRTSFARLRPGQGVNLEQAVRASDRLDGHVVQGHVDGVGIVRTLEPEGGGMRLTVEAPPDLLRYLVDKGSVAIEGVSLTVASLRDDAFEIALIPHTLAETTLGELRPGDAVNLEVDVLAKYVERLLGATIGG
jgi:riboflavin synthase